MSARVICCGSRGWNDRQAVQDALCDVALELGTDITIVVGYDAEKDRPRGADRLIYQEAQKHGLRIETHPADWEGYTRADYERFGHKGAGRKRNQEMADGGAELCLSFWDGSSGGTNDMMQRARKAGIEVRRIHG